MGGLRALFALGLMFQPQLWQRLLMGRSPRANGLFDATDRLVLAYAEQVTVDANRVDDDLFDR